MNIRCNFPGDRILFLQHEDVCFSEESDQRFSSFLEIPCNKIAVPLDDIFPFIAFYIKWYSWLIQKREEPYSLYDEVIKWKMGISQCDYFAV